LGQVFNNDTAGGFIGSGFHGPVRAIGAGVAFLQPNSESPVDASGFYR